MADRLKVFVNTVDATTVGEVSTIPLITTAATTQAVIKNITYSSSNPLIDLKTEISHDGAIISTSSTGNSVSLAGTHIIDISSSLDLVLTCLPESVPAIANAMAFDATDGMVTIDGVVDSNGMDYTAAIDATLYSTTVSISSSFKADSATAWYDVATGEPRFARTYANVTYAYDEAGTLKFTSTNWDASTQGVCNDGTYLYGISSTTSTNLQRKLCSDGTSASAITMDTSVTGQLGNQGSFCLYYGGFIYARANGTLTSINKINVATGVVSLISVASVGSYSAGALITVARDGVAYLMECGTGGNQGFIMNLETEAIVYPVHSSLVVGTEYGNMALEIAAGVAIFFYSNSHVWFDANTMTGSGNIDNGQLTLLLAARPWASTVDASSIANLPLHTTREFLLGSTDTTYSVYVDGVEVTGVT